MGQTPVRHRSSGLLKPLSLSWGRAGGAGYSQSVYCWSWANSAGLSEIQPPSLIFRRQSPLGWATSCCAPRAGLGAAGPGWPLGHISTVRGSGGSGPSGTILLSPGVANPRARSSRSALSSLEQGQKERRKSAAAPGERRLSPYLPPGFSRGSQCDWSRRKDTIN